MCAAVAALDRLVGELPRAHPPVGFGRLAGRLEAMINRAPPADGGVTAEALREAGIPGTGTASDAVCVLCPTGGPVEPFAGPRSLWGSRLARAVHAAVRAGLDRV